MAGRSTESLGVMKRGNAVRLVSAIAAATALGFKSGSARFMWRLFSWFTVSWMIAAVVIILVAALFIMRGQFSINDPVSVLLAAVAGVASVVVGLALLWFVIPEIPALVLIVILGPPVVLFHIFKLFDALFSPVESQTAPDEGAQHDA